MPAQKIAWPFEHTVRVAWRDIDGAGHVNNAVYFTFFETARVEVFMKLRGGNDLKDLDIILASTACDFVSPSFMREDLVVSVRPTRVGKSSFDFAYEVTEKKTGRAVAHGTSTQVMFDYTAQKSKPVPDDVRAVLEAGLETPP